MKRARKQQFTETTLDDFLKKKSTPWRVMRGDKLLAVSGDEATARRVARVIGGGAFVVHRSEEIKR